MAKSQDECFNWDCESGRMVFRIGAVPGDGARHEISLEAPRLVKQTSASMPAARTLFRDPAGRGFPRKRRQVCHQAGSGVNPKLQCRNVNFGFGGDSQAAKSKSACSRAFPRSLPHPFFSRIFPRSLPHPLSSRRRSKGYGFCWEQRRHHSLSEAVWARFCRCSPLRRHDRSRPHAPASIRKTPKPFPF